MTDIAEKTMESLWGYIEHGDFNRSIERLKSFDYDADVVDFVLDYDSYYFPNRRGDRLVRPAGVGEERIPVVALEVGTTAVRLERPALHHLQKLALERAGLTASTIRAAEAEFADMDGLISTNGSSHGSMSVHRKLAKNQQRPGSQIESRPTLLFNADSSRLAETPLCTGAAFHELVHVAQSLSGGLWDWDDKARLRRELEAYSPQAALVRSYRVPYTHNTICAAEVDSFRAKHLGPNNFDVDDYFLREFRAEPRFKNILWQRPSDS